MKDLISVSHGLGQLVFHLQFCPKYRYSVFRKEENKKDCETILCKVAEKYCIKIMELAVCDDHVHLIVALHVSMSVAKATQLLKGASAYQLFRSHPNYRKRYPRGHFWSPGTFYRSVGDADLQTVKKYVKAQKTITQYQ